MTSSQSVPPYEDDIAKRVGALIDTMEALKTELWTYYEYYVGPGEDLGILPRSIDFMASLLKVGCGTKPNLEGVAGLNILGIAWVDHKEETECLEKLENWSSGLAPGSKVTLSATAFESAKILLEKIDGCYNARLEEVTQVPPGKEPKIEQHHPSSSSGSTCTDNVIIATSPNANTSSTASEDGGNESIAGSEDGTMVQIPESA